jgi:hypothetical protein
MPLKQAFQFVRSKRRHTNPNFGFLHQLCEFERELLNAAVIPAPDSPGSSGSFLVEHIRSIWPDYTQHKSDEDILTILAKGKYNHIQVLYYLRNDGLANGLSNGASSTAPDEAALSAAASHVGSDIGEAQAATGSSEL